MVSRCDSLVICYPPTIINGATFSFTACDEDCALTKINCIALGDYENDEIRELVQAMHMNLVPREDVDDSDDESEKWVPK